MYADNNHLPFGGGEVRIQQYLSLSKETDCRVVLENKTLDGLKKSVKRLKDNSYK